MRTLLATLLLLRGWRLRPEGGDGLDEAVRSLWRWAALIVGILVIGEVLDLLGAGP